MEEAVTSRGAARVPLNRDAIAEISDGLGFEIRSASIREMNKFVNIVEQKLGLRFVRMEFGIPGLPVHPIATEAEIDALRRQRLAHVYSPFEGVPALKEEASRFVRLFMDLDVPATSCIPTVGAMEGCFAGLALAARMRKEARTVVFLEPSFPVNHLQTRFLGLKTEHIDFYDHRGPDLVRALEARVAQGDVCAVLWSSPNNPSWIVLKESELEGIGQVCDRHGVIAIEDLAYFGMDTRENYLVPGEPPHQPTVLRHTRHGICVISSSKMFSYAGQRIAVTVLSPDLVRTQAPDLREFYGTANVGHAFVHGVLYPIAACVPQSPQYGLLALLKAANEGRSELFEPAREYSRRAAIMKKIFVENGFRLVYDNDLGEPLADGFYFTIAHPGFEDGADLLSELLHHGISAITLETTGSCRREGLRACVSLVDDEQYDTLAERLGKFRESHPA